MKLKKKIIGAVFAVVFLPICQGMIFAEDARTQEGENKKINSISSINWGAEINRAEKENIYPEKRKITPETVRRTLQEFYIPNVSEFLDAGVDYFEWLNTLDDPYLGRYKVDLRVDPDDERVKLFWKRKF